MNHCLLCLSDSIYNYTIIDHIQYLKCNDCDSIFKHPKHHLSSEVEHRRYLNHHNDVHDLRYQQFVAPIVQKVRQKSDIKNVGLDFGAGSGPVITKLLEDEGYSIDLYDPFFYPDNRVLSNKYDFIICCEVIEHFFNPYKEFKLLKKLLNPNGMLIIMTEMIPKELPFDNWYYIKDPTHVFFYSVKSLNWIKDHFSFSTVFVDGRTIEMIN